MLRAGIERLAIGILFLPARVGGSSGDHAGRSCGGFAPVAPTAINWPLRHPRSFRQADSAMLFFSSTFWLSLTLVILYIILYYNCSSLRGSLHFSNPTPRKTLWRDVGRKAPCSSSLRVNKTARRETKEVRQ